MAINTEFVLRFALYFGAAICLYLAIWYALYIRNRKIMRKQKEIEIQQNQQLNT